jgi:hypothetical protein
MQLGDGDGRREGPDEEDEDDGGAATSTHFSVEGHNLNMF